MSKAGEMQDQEEAIDPAIARFGNALAEAYGRYPGLETRSLPERRAIAEEVRAPWREGGPEMASRRDFAVPTIEGDVRVRLFDPTGHAAPRGALVYIHGGGFTSFSLETHDRLMREYAGRTGALVFGVDYALSPEAKFPVALNQVSGVIAWLATSGADLGVDPARIAVGGDSAGANLSLSAALKLRDDGVAVKLAGLVLNYGFFDADFETPSQRRHGGSDKLLTTEELVWFLDNYVEGTPHRDHPHALPALAELHDLPPTFHVIAQCDPLADGDRAMMQRLRAAGGIAEGGVYVGATHSFLEAVSISHIAEQALADSCAWLTTRLA
jgi:acetyl esterase